MVNTFLISSDFTETARILDSRRLLKQRVEAKQIIDSIELGTGWKHHPATKMWRNHVDALKQYYNCMVKESMRRGYKNNMSLFEESSLTVVYPKWLFNEKIHFSHQARLIAKNSEYYKNLFTSLPDIYNKYGYIWPSKWTENDLDTKSVEEIAEPYVEIDFCNGITKKTGKKCINKATNDGFCGLHKKQKLNNKIENFIF